MNESEKSNTRTVSVKQTSASTDQPMAPNSTDTPVTNGATNGATDGLAMIASIVGQALTQKNEVLIFDDSKEKLEKAMKNDKLDLSGLLNVLDGVVDTPGR
jgi:hypothetical protein